MNNRYDDQQQRQQLLNIVDRGTTQQLFTFLQGFHRKPFQNLADVIKYTGVIDDEIKFIDCTGTKYNVTPLIIAAGKGSFEKTKILLVHGANPNKQCATGDTALNLAVHRQKYPVVDLLLQYKANPNLYNQAGKTALHRAVLSYTDGNIKQIQKLLDAGADPNIEDRNQRIPLDEAVIANRPEIIDMLLFHNRNLINRSYRAAIIASRLGHDKCLETLFNYGLNPNITDATNTTPLHVAVRSMQSSTARILVNNGADQNITNNRGETATTIAEYLPSNEQQNFINILGHTPQTTLSNIHSHKSGNSVSYVCPLLRNHFNWTLDSNEFRSSTAENSSVQNLLDTSNDTYWCCTQSKNAWIIFDLKHEYNLTGIRIIGCDNQSTPKDGHIDVSNAVNGPWLKVKEFTCLITQGNKNDFLFSSLKTRFIRVFILNNYGGEDIRIQEISFFGVDMRLIDLLKEYGLENSLSTLLANNINDEETLYENQDEILNSSDKFLHLNDHFQFIRLTESLKCPQLTFLEWFIPPKTTVIAGEKLPTFSVAADEGITDRVKLEEKLENNPQANTILMRDLEPIQGRSLVDFPDYIIKHPGRYKIRVISVEHPDIHTPWQEIVVGSTSPYAHRLNTTGGDEHLYLLSTSRFANDTTATSDKENTLFPHKKSTTNFSNKDNRGLVAEVYESELDETDDDTYLRSIKSIEDSPYYFSLTNMSSTTNSTFVNYRPEERYKPDHFTQTKSIDFYDHTTNIDDDYDEGYTSSSRLNSKASPEIYITPTKYRSVSRTPLSNILQYSSTNSQKQSDDNDMVNYGDKIIIPTKYRLRQERINRLLDNENMSRSEQHQRQSQNEESPKQHQLPRKRIQSAEKPLPQQKQQSHHQSRRQSQQRDESPRQSSPEQIQSDYHEIDQPQKQTESRQELLSPVQRQSSRKRTDSEDESLQHQSQSYGQRSVENEKILIRNLSPLSTPKIPSNYEPRESNRQRNGSARHPSPSQEQQQADYYELEVSPEKNEPVPESPSRKLRRRTDSEDESVHEKSEYFGQSPRQNENIRIQHISPPPPSKKSSAYEPIEQSRQQNGLTRESSPPAQEDYSNYDEIDQTPKRIPSTQESPVQQHQLAYYGQQPTRQQNDLRSRTPPSTITQQIHKRNESPTEQHHHISTGNIGQDNSKLLYKRYRITAGEFELRESPSENSLHANESNSGQFELVFKATLQGNKVQERANDSIQNIIINRSRTPSTPNNYNQNNSNTVPTSNNNHESPINADLQNQNLDSNYEDNFQIRSSHNSRLNSVPQITQSPTDRTNYDHDKPRNIKDDQNLATSYSPTTSRKKQFPSTLSSPHSLNRQDNDRLPADNLPAPSLTNPHVEHGDDLDGIRPRSRSSSQSHRATDDEKIPLNKTNNLPNSRLLTPSKSSEQKNKYYFGENIQDPVSDEESDGADCEMFGHNSQPRPLTNTTTRRNLDYPSTTTPRFPTQNNNNSGNPQFGQQSDIGTTTDNNLTQQHPQTSVSKNELPLADHEIPGTYRTTNNYDSLNQDVSDDASSTNGISQQHRVDSDQIDQNMGSNIKQKQSPSRFNQDRNESKQIQDDDDSHEHDSDDASNHQVDDDDDVHDPVHGYQNDTHYISTADDDDEQIPRDDESPDVTISHVPAANQLLRQNPVQNVPTSFLRTQYPSSPALASSQPYIDNTASKKKKGFFSFLKSDKKKNVDRKTRSSKQKPSKSKKPLEITVRTADHSHFYTSGIIPPKLPSTPTTDITDEIHESESFDKPHTFRLLDTYRRDSQDNNEEDVEDSDIMSEVQPHNRDRAVQHQIESKTPRRDYGTQVDEKSTRTIGTMSEPIKTRNSGNEVQPQSSATQTTNFFPQQQENDEIDFQQSTSQRLRHDTRTNGDYSSQRPTSLDHRNKYVPSSSIVPQHKDRLDYEQHRSQYNDDPHRQYIIIRDSDYLPHTSSSSRHRIPSPTSPHRTPPPPVQYRSASSYGRYRTSSPSDHHRSRSSSIKKQNRSVSPSSQRRSRSPQRSISPPVSKHNITSSSHHTPSPPPEYRSKLPNDRYPPLSSSPTSYSHRTKNRPQMISVETDTSLDGIKPTQHRDHRSESPLTQRYGTLTTVEKQHPSQTSHSNNLNRRSPTSNYQKLDSNPTKHQDYTKKGPYQDDQSPSTRKNYRLRSVRNDSYTNNYEEIPPKHNASISSPLNRSFDRPKEYTPKSHTNNRRQQVSPPIAQQSDDEEQYPIRSFNNEKHIRELPTSGSVSIPSTTIIQPDTLPRSHGQNKSPTHQNRHHVDNRRKTPELSLHRAHEQDTPSRHSPPLNFGTPHISHQSPLNEVAAPFKIRYIQDTDNEFSTNNANIRSSTLKRDSLRSQANRILLLPVLNSSRTYVFEKQSLPANRMRQSRTNGNFYLATSPTLNSLNSSIRVDESENDPLTHMDSDHLTGHTLRSQVA